MTQATDKALKPAYLSKDAFAQTVKDALWEKTGVSFFQELTCLLSRELGIDYVMIGEFRQEFLQARTISVGRNGQVGENYEFFVADAPCQTLLSADFYYAPNVSEAFKDAPLASSDVFAYMAYALKDSKDNLLGFISLAHSSEFPDAETVKWLLAQLVGRACAVLVQYREKRELYGQVMEAKIHEKRASAVLEAVPQALIILDETYHIDHINEVACRLFSRQLKRIQGTPVNDIALYRADGQLYDMSSLVKRSKKGRVVEVHHVGQGGQQLLLSLCITSYRWQGRNFYILVFTDNTSLHVSEAELERRKYYDELTGLPNRQYLMEALTQTIEAAEESGEYGGLLFVDLDRFKDINDSLGRRAGDIVLKRTVKTLKDIVGDEYALAGLGGDEFVIVFSGAESLDIANALAQNLAYTIGPMISTPINIDDRELVVTSCIGVALFPRAGGSAEEVLQQADVAVSGGKAKGENQVVFYDSAMGTEAKRSLDLLGYLHKALHEHEFVLFVQPKISADTGQIAGGESLVRWQRPGVGMVAPFEFISVLEASGLIVSVGEWVLEESCRFVRNMLNDGLWPDGCPISVNVSPKQFSEPEFEFSVQRILDQFGLAPSMLELEVTETVIMENLEEVLPKMQYLQSLGVTFAIDDFGTGYSSMVYLKKLPISTLKIDREFVKDIHEDSDNRGLVQAMVGVSRQFDLKVVAEGVENQQELSVLDDVGCDLYQGFHFSRPIPLDDFRSLLAEPQ